MHNSGLIKGGSLDNALFVGTCFIFVCIITVFSTGLAVGTAQNDLFVNKTWY